MIKLIKKIAKWYFNNAARMYPSGTIPRMF